MQPLRKRREDSDFSPEPQPTEQLAPSDVAQRICKLRWLGMHKEAARLQMRLQGVQLTEYVILEPRDTD